MMWSPASLTAHHEIAHAIELLGEFRQFVIVRGEQSLGAGAQVNVLHHAQASASRRK